MTLVRKYTAILPQILLLKIGKFDCKGIVVVGNANNPTKPLTFSKGRKVWH